MNLMLKTILHLFFWTVYFLLAGFLSFGLDNWLSFIQQNLGSFAISTVWSLVAFYTFYFVLYRFIAQRRFGRYFILAVLSSLAISTFFILFVMLVMSPALNFSAEWSLSTTAGTFVIANCGSLVRGFIGWIDASRQHEEAQCRNLHLELEMLRSQINPHFLFNTLNNIDALIATQPQRASEMVIALSGVMRYMLYETACESVPVAKEAEHLDNVLSLQRMRFASSEYIRWQCSLTDPSATIAPLLLVPFVENACKHACHTGTYPVIDISLRQESGTLEFNCTNTYSDKATAPGEMGGIGLENVKKRLQLLYPDTHSLEIVKKDATFSVSLRISTL